MQQFLFEYSGLLGLFTTLFFGLLSLALYIKSKRNKKPIFTYNNILLQTKAHPNISIHFKKEKIENLSRLFILFWNRGNKEIRKEDIPASHAPFIKFVNDSRILSYSLIDSSVNEINFSIEKISSTTLNFSFEYLNPKDGAVVEVLYENKSKKGEVPFDAKATIVGASVAEVRTCFREVPLGWFILGMTIALAYTVSYGSVNIWQSISSNEIDMGLLLWGSFNALVGIIFAWLSINIRFQNYVPKYARKYLEQ